MCAELKRYFRTCESLAPWYITEKTLDVHKYATGRRNYAKWSIAGWDGSVLTRFAVAR